MKIPPKHLTTGDSLQNEPYTCPCCGYKTFTDHPGSYNICPVCFWEDDPVQLEHPDSAVGANKVSLKLAQRNFIEFGACTLEMKRWVRPPLNDEPKDPDWQLFP